MATLMNPGSLLSQFANFFFLASGLFNDLLIIRICLVFAYGFLFIISLMGLPGWGDSPLWTGRMAVDILVWSILNIVVVHGSGVIRMYYDERRINFATKESEMLWRFFYRHSGLSKAQFQALVLPHTKLKVFSEGDTIPCKDQFCILLDGMVLCQISHQDATVNKRTIRLASGDMFPLLHIYNNYVPRRAVFQRSTLFGDPVVETQQARAFCIPLIKLEEMATHPNARDAWTAMLIATLAEIAERQYTSAYSSEVDESRSAKRLSSTQTLQDSNSQHHPLFAPLSATEEPDPLLSGSGQGLSKPLQHAWRYVVLSVYMPWPWGKWPVGLRHNLKPPIEAQEPEKV